MTEETRRGPGRPPAQKEQMVEREPLRERPRYKMRATPNWETVDEDAIDTPDRLHIPKDRIPDGMSFQWVTETVYGQPMPQHRADFEKRGWTPVHQEDFDGILDGLFMPKGASGEIKTEGLVLMARPEEFTARAREIEARRAREVVRLKEQTLRSGDIPISLDARHPTAVRSNIVQKTVERLEIRDDK